MEFNEREVIFYYNFESQKDREALAYAKSLTNHIKEFDIFKYTPSESYLAEMAKMLNIEIDEIINKKSEVYQKDFADKDLDFGGWMRALVQNPGMIKTPLCFFGRKGIIVNTPSDILKLDPEGGFKNIKL